MIIVNDRPVNGVDLSHWNADVTAAELFSQRWIQMMGHKVTHPAGANVVNGVDPKFAARRKIAADLDIRWRPFYAWVVPPTVSRPAAQVALLKNTVGELAPGESVYLDWEDVSVLLPTIEELTVYMDLEFPGRWFMYINDSSPDMLSWLNSNNVTQDVPVMHPNYNLDKGLSEALKWRAMIWQTGEGTPPGFKSVVPMDYVLKPELMDWVSGRL